MDKKPGLDAAYGLTSSDEVLRLYADWAETYDTDFIATADYRLPELVAEAFAAAGGAGPVLDIGAGTGALGVGLAARGIGQVDATDLSAEMLEVAARKGVYGRVFAGDVTGRLPVEDGAYRAAVSSGTFTHGHVGPGALPEVLRCVAPGGIVVLSVNAEHWEKLGFAEALRGLGPLVAASEITEVPIYGPGNTGPHAGDTALIMVLRRA